MADTREEARAVMQAMFARKTGEAHASASGGLLDLQPLMARWLFERRTLDAKARMDAGITFATWISRVAAALETTPREALASMIGGAFPLVPPRAIPKHVYLGAFYTDGNVIVTDPCYRDERPSNRSMMLATHLRVRKGKWHAYVLPHEPDPIVRTAALVAIHEEGFAITAAQDAGNAGVDSGTAGIFDETFVRRSEDDSAFPEAVIDRRAVVASSGFGDGGYPVFVGRNTSDEISKIRVPFIGSIVPLEIDSTMHTATAARAYSPKERFAVGQTLVHPKFGTGTVVSASDAKIEVVFVNEDERRVLIHGKA